MNLTSKHAVKFLKNKTFRNYSQFYSSRSVLGKLILSMCFFTSAILMMGARGCDSGNSNGLVFPSEQATALQESLEQAKVDFEFPGGAWAVRKVGGATWMGTTGLASIASSQAATIAEAMSTDLHVRIGSMTKTFVATLIMKLAEEGKLRLEDTIDDWMGAGYYPFSNIITIRQLLNMTAGIANFTAVPEFNAAQAADPEHTFQPEELVSFVRDSSTPSSFSPEKGFLYSNTNYVILGLIAQKAGGVSFKELIENKILFPLGLYETFVPDGGDRSIPLNFARGYEPKADGSFKEVTSYSASVAFSSGNMISTLPNMLDWIQAISESSLLAEDSTNQMMGFVSQATGGQWNGSETGYGLGLMYSKGAVGHGGIINGYQVSVYKYKDHYFALIMNQDPGVPIIEEIFWRAVRTLYPNDGV